jgi:ribosomal protein L31
VQRSFRSGSAASTKNVEIISKSDPEVQRSFVFGSAASKKNVEIISKFHPKVQRSFESGSGASTKNVEIISKSHPEVQRSFGSGSAASMSKLFQSPIQKYSVHSGPEVQRPCRNYFKVRSRSTAFIRVRKCSVHVEIISKSDPEVQRSLGSGSAASMSKLFQSPIQKYSVHSGPEVQRPCRNYFKVRSRSTAFIWVRKCSVHVESIAKSHPEVQRSFESGSGASTKNVEIISKSHPEVQRSFNSRSAAFIQVRKCNVNKKCRNYFQVRSRSAAFVRVR